MPTSGGNRLRLVLDTNVVVAGLVSKSQTCLWLPWHLLVISNQE